MPNAKGGKGYKKKKKGAEAADQPLITLDRQEGQMVARAIRLLGNRNVLCFCNDSRLRICHICGRMKGRAWIEPGDMLLVSLRDFTGEEMSAATSGNVMRGDVIGKYDTRQLSDLKKERGINEKLFMRLENMDGMTLTEVGQDKSKDKMLVAEDDFGFTFEGGSGDDDEDDSTGSGSDENKPPPKPRGARQMEANKIITKGGDGSDDDDLDIDAI